MELYIECMHACIQLINEMDYYGINEALVYHIRDLEAGVSDALPDLLEFVKGEPRLHASATIVPPVTEEQGPPELFVKDLIGKGIRAVRVFPKWHRFVFRPYVLDSALGELERHHVPLFVSYWALLLIFGRHNWTGKKSDRYLKLFQSLPVVATFLGMQNNRFIYPLLKKFENFYVETSTFTYRFIEDVSKKFGAKRILYGSQLPMFDHIAAHIGKGYPDLRTRGCVWRLSW